MRKIGDTFGEFGAGASASLQGGGASESSVQPHRHGAPSGELAALSTVGRPSTGEPRAALSFLIPMSGNSTSVPPSAVLLDLDGTLVDSTEYQALAWVLVAKEAFDYDLEIEEAHHFKGSNLQIIMMLAERADQPCTPQVAKFWEHRRDELFRELVEKNPLQARDGVPDFLNLLKENKVPFAIVTNSVEPNAWKQLHKTGLADHFPTRQVITPSRLIPPKPDSLGVKTAAERIGQPTDACFMLDDTPPGVDASEDGDTWGTGIVNNTVPRDKFGPTPEGRIRIFTDFPHLTEMWLAERGR